MYSYKPLFSSSFLSQHTILSNPKKKKKKSSSPSNFPSFSCFPNKSIAMRMSCNGCRVLRKGCSDSCSIKPCLQWIKSAESQSNATLFLAKFYGRAGLINLINAGPEHLRPAIFRSLLYEACGRIVNPVYGSVGLLWSGSWQLCQAAVDAVLRGEKITQLSSSESALKACDIRHVSKDDNSAVCDQLRKVNSKRQFKRSAPKPNPKLEPTFDLMTELGVAGSESHESVLSWRPSLVGDSGEGDSVSVETVEASLAPLDERADVSDVALELTLGFH